MSQIVAALGGPSISGAGAGFSFGRRIVRSFVAFHPLAAFADRLADCFGPLVTAGAPALPAVDGRLRLAGGVVCHDDRGLKLIDAHRKPGARRGGDFLLPALGGHPVPRDICLSGEFVQRDEDRVILGLANASVPSGK